jgi:hypothetical protein
MSRAIPTFLGMMLFENQNRYKQCIVQESTLLFLPVLMVKTDNSQAVTKNVFKHVKGAVPNLFEQVSCLSHRFQPVANMGNDSRFGSTAHFYPLRLCLLASLR